MLHTLRLVMIQTSEKNSESVAAFGTKILLLDVMVACPVSQAKTREANLHVSVEKKLT